MIKHIFSDMDGTLLDSKGNVSAENIQAIKHSQIPFTLVSARAPMEMATAITELDLHEPQIAFNGGLIFQKENGFKVLKSDALSHNSFQKIMQLIKEDFPEVSCSCYDLNSWYTERVDYGIEFESSITGQKAQITDFAKLQDQKIYKVMLIATSDPQLESLEEHLNALGLTDIAIKRSGLKYLEITNKKAQKSKGIKYIQKLQQLEKSDMAAFGDGHNDLPMLKEVGIPIVMDNALDEIKSYGKYITKSNIDNGVAYGIKHYLEVE